MNYRQLPGTDIGLSEVGFGVWTVSTGWWGNISEVDGVRLLQEAVEQGVTLFDTADTYGKGYGEEILAKALANQRHNIVIATKFGYDFYDSASRIGHNERPQRFETQFIRYACEQSLRRLRTEYIDLYQLHNPQLETIENDEVFATLEDLVREGKVRHYATALGPDIGWFEEGEASMRKRKVRAVQIIYNILEQEPASRFFPIAEQENIGLISRVPHASDVLTRKYYQPPEFDPSDHRGHRKKDWIDQALKKAKMLKFLSEDTGRTLAQSAIKFCLAQSSIVSVLPNITGMEELTEYASTSETSPLSSEELEKLNELWQEGFYLEEEPTAVE